MQDGIFFATIRHMSLAPAYQKVRQEIVEFLRACRRGAG